MPEAPETGDRRRLLYGRHKGHRLRQRQATLVDETLPKLRLRLDAPCPDDLTRLFDVPVERVEMEIGFGGGEHLGFRAGENPCTGFIGCEPFVNGVAKLLVEIEERALRNVRVHDDDARQVLDWLPDASLDRIWLLYPDPWPKRRHRKRRFLSPENLDVLARVMKPGADLRFATDIDDYADRSLRLLADRTDFEWTARRADDWRRPWQPWPGTRYEAKAARAGRTPCYLTFRRL
ncbi:tRNA (guanine(46)-N(7))-methyltransferase TrmB [Microbaculum marinum]|uniref:tRNA (guanine-N(7)-)-methyltransferase n=1 Tax=Microbaculum marinum TaxID=1764581 RepID=A0AAW9RV17_9HYPH